MIYQYWFKSGDNIVTIVSAAGPIFAAESLCKILNVPGLDKMLASEMVKNGYIAKKTDGRRLIRRNPIGPQRAARNRRASYRNGVMRDENICLFFGSIRRCVLGIYFCYCNIRIFYGALFVAERRQRESK